MASDKNPPQPDLAGPESDIDREAASLSPEDPDNEMGELRQRLDDVGLLVEEVFQAKELHRSVSRYVEDLREELKDLKRFRLWTTVFSVVMSWLLFLLIGYCVAFAPEWFVALDGSVKVPFLIACGGGSVFLMSILLRGVYRSRSDRNRDEILPEHLKQIRDAVSGSE
ncbi:MAG: hypothetical protein GDA49_06745 [Rhodospirillales bacterium]|nr:hypothetical protein [Rhodospirillales bacterium]